MVKLEKAELLKIAQLSALKIDDNQAEALLAQIQTILNYTQELDQVKMKNQAEPVRNINLFRQDQVIPTDSTQILKEAPKTEKNYFVVPKILD